MSYESCRQWCADFRSWHRDVVALREVGPPSFAELAGIGQAVNVPNLLRIIGVAARLSGCREIDRAGALAFQCSFGLLRSSHAGFIAEFVAYQGI